MGQEMHVINELDNFLFLVSKIMNNKDFQVFITFDFDGEHYVIGFVLRSEKYL